MKKTFEQKYWSENYDDPQSMDGIGNATLHSGYLQSLFELEGIEISSIFDFGIGTGDLSKAMIHQFQVRKYKGIDISKFAVDAAGQKLAPYAKRPLLDEFIIEQISLENWAKKGSHANYDLGICTSVLQYIDDNHLDVVLGQMSKTIKFLYLTVPTYTELHYQKNTLEFFDRYAIPRSKSFYHKMISKHFTIISNRLLESKYFYNIKNSLFYEYLFRG